MSDEKTTRFRNATPHELEIRSLGIVVGPAGSENDETPDLTEEQAAGLRLQGDTWHEVGEEARAAQLDAIAQSEADAYLAAFPDAADQIAAAEAIPRPGPRANKSELLDYAAAVVAAMGGDDAAQAAARADADKLTIPKLRQALGLDEKTEG